MGLLDEMVGKLGDLVGGNQGEGQGLLAGVMEMLTSGEDKEYNGKNDDCNFKGLFHGLSLQ